MKKEMILEDKSLETLGLIKELDTLSIIENVCLVNEKRKLKFKNAALIITSATILLLNLFFIVLAGIKIFLLAQLMFSWIIPILFTPLLKKKSILEV